jgi:hypothetical protein
MKNEERERVEKLAAKLRRQVDASTGNLKSGQTQADHQLIDICLGHFNDIAAELEALSRSLLAGGGGEEGPALAATLSEAFGEPIHIDPRDYLEKILASLFRRQPAISGDQRERLHDTERRAVENVVDSLLKAFALAALPAPSPDKADAGDGWEPIATAPQAPGYIYVRETVTTAYRWLPYKKDGQRQMGKPGRWQKAVGDYGAFANAELPANATWTPIPTNTPGEG